MEISFEVLLPVALELYQKIPNTINSTFKPKNEEERKKYLQSIADEFSNFYNHLHDNLANHTK